MRWKVGKNLRRDNISKGQNPVVFQRSKEEEDLFEDKEEDASREWVKTYTPPDTAGCVPSFNDRNKPYPSDNNLLKLLHAGQVGADSREETGDTWNYESRRGDSDDDQEVASDPVEESKMKGATKKPKKERTMGSKGGAQGEDELEGFVEEPEKHTSKGSIPTVSPSPRTAVS